MNFIKFTEEYLEDLEILRKEWLIEFDIQIDKLREVYFDKLNMLCVNTHNEG